MRTVVAIPLFDHEVAPRFCFAVEALIVAFEAGEEVSRETITLGDLPWPDRLRLLARHEVGMLLCGGFNRLLLPAADGLGIAVVWGLCGDIDDVLTLLKQGRLPLRRHLEIGARPACCRRRGRGRGPLSDDLITPTIRRNRK